MQSSGDPLSAFFVETIRRVVREELDRILAQRSPAPATLGDYLTVRQAASVAQSCEASVRRWVRSGALKAAHAGRHLRLHRAELEKFLAAGGDATADESPAERAERHLARRVAGAK